MMATLQAIATPVDVDQCAQEPIHIIGQIQPHGLLFALSEPDLVVRYVSTNVSTFLGLSPVEVLGSSIRTVLGDDCYQAFNNQVMGPAFFYSSPLLVNTADGPLLMQSIIHRHDGMLIAELEVLEQIVSIQPLHLQAHLASPIAGMEAASNLPDLFHFAASEIKRISGFNRVMVYRFDEAWNGEVIAEAMDSSPVSYLGLRFPASDIPAQARRLFLANPLRAIADVDAVVVPICPFTAKPLDLTHSALRSASPIHLEYLCNMGVQASMTLSIIVKQKLWGMFACHHSTPRHLDFLTRSVCGVLCQVLASQVALRADNAAMQVRLDSHARLEEYMAGIEAEKAKSPANAQMFHADQLLQLMDADGLVANIDGVRSYHGVTLGDQLLIPVIDKLTNLSWRGIASCDSLAALDGPSAEPSEVGGALYLGLGAEERDYLVLLRRDLVETVIWAGNPDKTVTADDQGKLRPRSSFAAWQQTVRGRSRPWTSLELETAGVLREQMLAFQEAQKLRKSEERVRYLAHHDTLTGLINRHSIQLKLDQFVKAAALDGSSFSVLFVDLDRFKHFNDSFGHAAGDRVLQVAAMRMQHQVRALDVVGRLGGDEFIIILPGLKEEETYQIALRVLRAIQEPLEIDHHTTIGITASIGLSRYPSDGTTGETLVSRSDVAMYRVKRRGGNAYEVFTSGDVGRPQAMLAN